MLPPRSVFRCTRWIQDTTSPCVRWNYSEHRSHRLWVGPSELKHSVNKPSEPSARLFHPCHKLDDRLAEGNEQDAYHHGDPADGQKVWHFGICRVEPGQ